jgi:hypothetical protein
MDKINYITEQQDHKETQEIAGQLPITYDYIMSRLTRQFISHEVSNNANTLPTASTSKQPQNHIKQKLNPTTSARNVNSERLPGYVKPYVGKTPTGNLNTPASRQPQPNVNDRQAIEKYIRDLSSPTATNTSENTNKLLLLRKITLHNNRVMNEKIKLEKTRLKFQV